MMSGCDRDRPGSPATLRASIWRGGFGMLAILAAQACVADEIAPLNRQSPHAVSFCEGYGPTFFATSPDSCVRVGGLVMAEIRGVDVHFRPIDFGHAALGPVAGPGLPIAKRQTVGASSDALGRIELDVRQQTDYGPFRAFLRIEGTTPLTRP